MLIITQKTRIWKLANIEIEFGGMIVEHGQNCWALVMY